MFSLILYIKFKFSIKLWIIIKLIIKIIKNKITSKLLSYYKMSKKSIILYFKFIIVIYISFMFLIPFSPDNSYIYLILFVFIRHELKNLFFSISVWSVIPLAHYDSGLDLVDISNLEPEESEAEEEIIETINFTNFKNISHQEKEKYVDSKIKLKGLTSNTYLVEYFIRAILSNITSGSQLEVDKYLNGDLDILLKDNRNLQLNNHSFVRIRPFLLNNSNNSGFPSVVPYKSNNSIELDDDI